MKHSKLYLVRVYAQRIAAKEAWDICTNSECNQEYINASKPERKEIVSRRVDDGLKIYAHLHRGHTALFKRAFKESLELMLGEYDSHIEAHKNAHASRHLHHYPSEED